MVYDAGTAHNLMLSLRYKRDISEVKIALTDVLTTDKRDPIFDICGFTACWGNSASNLRHHFS